MLLYWFANYLTDKTLQLRMGTNLLVASLVYSGAIQGSCLEPELFMLQADILLR